MSQCSAIYGLVEMKNSGKTALDMIYATRAFFSIQGSSVLKGLFETY